MTDRGERAVRTLIQKRNGDEWDTADVRELIFAFADDQEDDHQETLAYITEHAVEAAKRDERLDGLEAWRRAQSAACPVLVEEAIADADERHLAFHNEHLASDHLPRREDDPDDADFTEKRGEPAWTVTQIVGGFWKAVALIALNGVVTTVVVFAIDKMLRP